MCDISDTLRGAIVRPHDVVLRRQPPDHVRAVTVRTVDSQLNSALQNKVDHSARVEQAYVTCLEPNRLW